MKIFSKMKNWILSGDLSHYYFSIADEVSKASYAHLFRFSLCDVRLIEQVQSSTLWMHEFTI